MIGLKVSPDRVFLFDEESQNRVDF
jgi:hypothetical protein